MLLKTLILNLKKNNFQQLNVDFQQILFELFSDQSNIFIFI